MIRTVIVEFYKRYNGRLEIFSVTAQEDDHPGMSIYDVQHSKGYGYFFHLSGGGFRLPAEVNGIYWSAAKGDVVETPCLIVGRAARKRNKTRRISLPKWFEGKDALVWLQDNAIEEEPVYCSECDDWQHPDHPCEHIWWCEETALWSSPGERIKTCNCEQCFIERDERIAA